MGVAEALGAVKSLTPDEQLELVDCVLADLHATEDEFELTEETRTELERRIAAHKADPSKALSFEDVSRRAKSRWGR